MHNKYWEQTFLHYLNKGLEHSIIYKWVGEPFLHFSSPREVKTQFKEEKCITSKGTQFFPDDFPFDPVNLFVLKLINITFM